MPGGTGGTHWPLRGPGAAEAELEEDEEETGV